MTPFHNTRSGDVAFNILKDSKAKSLISNGYAGYSKAVKDIKIKLNREVKEVNCNAHSFRYFVIPITLNNYGFMMRKV